MKVAFVTYKSFYTENKSTRYASRECLGLTRSDNKVRLFLKKNNIDCEPFSWDDQCCDINNYDMFIIRSAWNYYHSDKNFKAFMKFIKTIESRVYNYTDTIRWNAHKSYLYDLKSKGIPTVPTLFIPDMNSFNSESILHFIGSEEYVIIKPCISGAGRNSYCLPLSSIRYTSIDNIKSKLSSEGITEIIVQPFIKPILYKGELSIIFFRDKLSHAVRKLPKETDIFKHYKTFLARQVPKEALMIAEESLLASYEVLGLKRGSHLFARVDLIPDNKNKYLLSELELIEPDLFLQYHKESIETFGTQILNTIIKP
ncbi:MAG: hypothetical protein K0Q51_120 [Rickettsiaceae bacterium]|jgi:glutathione synthase/RimK-type ligase-like ATP-grasp enzyme|nr:hypothetical protein [Rickettsiaceae bacterium]